jgi:hypothetical protein
LRKTLEKAQLIHNGRKGSVVVWGWGVLEIDWKKKVGNVFGQMKSDANVLQKQVT